MLSRKAAIAAILPLFLAGCGNSVKPSKCPKFNPFPDLWAVCLKTPPGPNELFQQALCTRWGSCVAKGVETADCPWVEQTCEDMVPAPYDFAVKQPDLKPGGFGCAAALAGVDYYGRKCWSDKANFTGGKADPAKVLACQVAQDILVFGNISTPGGKGLFSLVLACMAAQCLKGGVLKYTDAKGVTINIGFDSSFTCINELVRGNNNACNNQLSTCNDDGELAPPPEAQAPVPGGGDLVQTVEVCVDVPPWPTTEPLPGNNGVVLIGDVAVDFAHGGRACQYMPVATGVVPN